MEKSAVVSHSKGIKHMEEMNNRNSISTLFFKENQNQVSFYPFVVHEISAFFIELNKDVVAKPFTEIACSSNCRSCKTTTNLTSLVIKSAVTKAEILWCLKTVLSFSLFHSCENILNLFSVVFSDSDTAKSFSVRKTTCAYYINFGIAPYFKDLLLEKLKSSKYIVVSYDDSLNTILEEEQMDILVRFFNETT